MMAPAGAALAAVSLTVMFALGGPDAMGGLAVLPMVTFVAGVILLLIGLDMAPHGPTVSIHVEVARNGIDRFLADCTLVAGPIPDPGHPGGMPLALWRPPRGYGRILVLECFNGTPGADGRYERLVKGVGHRYTDPMAAAAASYGVTPDQYAPMQSRV